MAISLVRMVTYLDGLLPVKPHGPLVTRTCKITWRIKTIISPPLECRIVVYLEQLLPIMLLDPLVTRCCKTILNDCISSSTELIATKLDRMVTYLHWLLPRNSSTVWSVGLSKSRDKIKCYFPTITAPVATKHGRMLTDLPWETYSSQVI